MTIATERVAVDKVVAMEPVTMLQRNFVVVTLFTISVIVLSIKPVSRIP